MTRNDLVLLVDDEVGFCQELRESLEELNYRVITAADKKEAWEIANHSTPTLIAIGTISPRGDSFKLHRWFKKNSTFASVPQLFLDAPVEKQFTRGLRKDEGLRLEAEEFFCKPVEPYALAKVMNGLVDGSIAYDNIKVLIAEDHDMVREGMRTLLNLQKDITIVGEATHGKEAVEKALELKPDVILMDIVMPEKNGIEATFEISKKAKNDVKILMLSQYDDSQNINASKEALAYGFISKKGASSQLLEAVRAAGRGEEIKFEQYAY